MVAIPFEMRMRELWWRIAPKHDNLKVELAIESRLKTRENQRREVSRGLGMARERKEAMVSTVLRCVVGRVVEANVDSGTVIVMHG